MANLLDRIDGFLESYGEFVNNLGSVTLLSLAAATVISGVYSLSCTGISTVTENLYQIQGFAMLYLILVALYIRYLRRQEPQNPAPIQYPAIRQCLSSGYYVASLAFFFTAFEPLGSVRNIHVPVICLCSFLHLLILFAIMRLREDHGISRACLFASLFVVFPVAETKLERTIVVFATIFLSLISLVQLTPPPLPKKQIPILSKEEWLIQYRLEKSLRKSQKTIQR